MPSPSSLVLLLAAAGGLAAADLPYFSVLSADPGSWPAVLSSIGLQSQPAGTARIFVAREGAPASPEWAGRVDRGAILILEGESSLAEMFGFRRSARDFVKVNSLVDVHRPALPIVWETGLELPVMELPPGALVFARERWYAAPLMAGIHRGKGAVLWVGVPPGERGYERFPYLINALCDLGLEPPFQSSRLWAFFDSAYRSRVDLDYFAERWRRSGIAALHVAAWHFYDRSAEQDEYLRKLIEACHRQGIAVYAWLELPHVSERFWADHPEWRERTAIGQDAQLDWRKLMNLTNRDCFRSVAAGIGRLVSEFDWDGVNLAELYFESLEGISNPARFTPMNADVRSDFANLAGYDPIELWTTRSDQTSRRQFLEYRVQLAGRIQQEWINEIEKLRQRKPYLDLVLTHVDDRFDPGIRDAIGADASLLLPLLDSHSFTFLIEDPATVWNLGAQRYRAIAEKYHALTPQDGRLAIDLNIVERYQNVYPTKQQTGIELFQLVHQAAASFPRLALYFENSLQPLDLRLLSSAAASVSRVSRLGPKTVVEATAGVGLPWKGAAKVDGALWPVIDDATVWLPAGAHGVETAADHRSLRLLRVNAELNSARYVDSSTVEFTYQSQCRAFVIVDRVVQSLEIDGQPAALPASTTLVLPKGQHVVTVTAQ